MEEKLQTRIVSNVEFFEDEVGSIIKDFNLSSKLNPKDLFDSFLSLLEYIDTNSDWKLHTPKKSNLNRFDKNEPLIRVYVNKLIAKRIVPGLVNDLSEFWDVFEIGSQYRTCLFVFEIRVGDEIVMMTIDAKDLYCTFFAFIVSDGIIDCNKKFLFTSLFSNKAKVAGCIQVNWPYEEALKLILKIILLPKFVGDWIITLDFCQGLF